MTSDDFIDVDAINISGDLLEVKRERDWIWKSFAALAVFLIALTATIGTFGMLKRIDDFNAESRCRSELVTEHELVRSEFDEILAGLIISSAADDKVALATINDSARDLYPRLQETREARANASVTCAAAG